MGEAHATTKGQAGVVVSTSYFCSPETPAKFWWLGVHLNTRSHVLLCSSQATPVSRLGSNSATCVTTMARLHLVLILIGP
jgi:hypothetical protein